MKILIIAPHPFYQERGTPIAIDLLLQVLSRRGDRVDLLTFHEGESRSYPGVTIHRIPALPGLANIPPGFSLKKLVCDALLLPRLIGLLRRGRYDVVHAVEESAFLAMLVCPFFSAPFIYDMDSLLSMQLTDHFPWLRPFGGLLRYIESLPIRRARLVLPMCERLATEAAHYRADGIVVLKDVSLAQGADTAPDPALALPRPIVMYIGNLEHYQGIDLLLEGFRVALAAHPTASLVIIGGKDEHIRKYRARAHALGVATSTHFLGPRPVAEIQTYMGQADVLASPRVRGINTPMKIYSYLDSGTAVLATDLPTHTQVINSDLALLAPPEATAFGAALARLLAEPELRRRLAANARAYVRREHSFERFTLTVNAVYDRLCAPRRTP